MIRFFSIVMLACTLLLPSLVWAGSSQTGGTHLPKDQVAAFSNRVQMDLAARGARVAIVARMGRDPKVLPAGVKYTHVAYWVYSQITKADGSKGRGYHVYNLYQRADNAARSDLVQEAPAHYFAGAYALDAGIIIPDARLQTKLLKTIASSTYADLHNPTYSVLANPNTNQFQNCTEHTLNVLMASLYGTRDLGQIKANIAAHFTPQTIAMGGSKRFLAQLASKGLVTTDHGRTVRTTTFSSIARFMQQHDLAQDIYRLTPNRVAAF